jgi:hypothetical protein
MKKKFEIGKAYEHSSGMQVFICGMADTVYHGICFIAENGWNRDKLLKRQNEATKNNEIIPSDFFDNKNLSPISMSNDAMENWFEIPKNDFIVNNTGN